MLRSLCGMLLLVLLLTSCQSQKRATDTPAAPAHDVPAAAYPGPSSENQTQTGQASPTSLPYPGPVVNNPSSAYPAPGASAVQTPLPNEYAPAPGDVAMMRGNAFVEISASQLVLQESHPLQVKIHLKGSLPNPCYHLRVKPAQPDDQKHIQVEVYSVAEKGKMCTEVLQDFEAEVLLGSFASGHYWVYINGELLGEFHA